MTKRQRTGLIISRIEEMKELFKVLRINTDVLDFIGADVERMPAADIKAGYDWTEQLYEHYKYLMRIWRTQEEDVWKRYLTWDNLRDNPTFKLLDNECKIIVKYMNKRNRPDIFKKTKRAKYAKSKTKKAASTENEDS